MKEWVQIPVAQAAGHLMVPRDVLETFLGYGDKIC
jgi:hypothetical protein